MVPIRDPNLIGRKIDCPKCKYRFVVEDPGDLADADEEAPKAKKGKRGEEEENGKRLKGKAGPHTRDEDDEGEEKAGAKSGANKLPLIIGVSAVALVVLVVVGYFLFFSGDSSSTTSHTPSSGGGGGSASSGQTAASEEKTEAAPQPGQTTGEFITNLLPPTTEGVCCVRLQDLLKTALGRAVFNPGPFDIEALEKKLGFLVDNVDLMVMAWNFRENWSLNALHATKPMDMNKVKAALRAVPQKEKIADQEYFVLEPNPRLDLLGHSTFSLLLQTRAADVPKRSGPLAMQIYDAQTLVFADLRPMQEFLKVKGRFPNQTAEAPKEEKTEEAQPAGGGSKMQGMAGMMGMMKGGAGGPPGGGMRPGGGGPGRPGQAQEPEPPAPVASGNYLTIRSQLKTMLDRLEAKKPIISLALDLQAASQSRVRPLSLKTLDLQVLFQDANFIGAALLTKDGITLTLASAFGSDDDARRRLRVMEGQEAKDLADKLTKVMKSKVEAPDVESDQQTAQQGAGAGGFNGPQGPGGMGGGAAMMMRMMGQGGRPGGAGAGAGGRRGGGGGLDGGDVGPGGGGFPGMGGFGGPAGRGQEPPKAEKANSNIKIGIQEKTTVVLTISLTDPAANSQLMNGAIRQEVMKQKGLFDMAAGGSQIHELALVLRSYPETHQGEFPRGTADRKIPTSRFGRPYSPDQRVSFFAELLPYLGPEQASLYSRIDMQQSWRDPDNLMAAATLVPQFLDPQNPPNTWWVRYPGNKEDSAATHFVGIAGVGMDAAEYAELDPAAIPKRGIFAYDHATKLRDITDKTSETILLAQVPTNFKRPWMAGGGSTVMGVPEKNSIKPFISTQRDGKRGTNVIMADGSVRFLSENISDEVFKALCTAKGGEPVLLTDRDAPLIPPPQGQAEQKNVAPLPVPPPPVKPKEEPIVPKQEKAQAKREVSNDQAVLVFQKNCATCHTGARAKGEMQLFTSPGVFNSRAPRDKIQEMLAEGKMPPKGRPRLGQADLATLQAWLAN
jgi:hypothetical protein